MNKPITLTTFFLLFLELEMVLYFLNDDIYFQLSGFYMPAFIALIFGCLKILTGDIKFGIPQVALILFIFLCACSYLLNWGVNERGYTLSYIFLIALTFILISTDLKEEQKNGVCNAYIFAAVIIAAIILLFRVEYYEGVSRLTIKVGDRPKIDPNYLAFFFVGPFILSAKRMIEVAGNAKKTIFLLCMLLFGVATLVTGSRGALVSILLAACCFYIKILCWLKKNRRNTQILCILLLTFCGIAVCIFLFSDEIISRLDITTWMDASNLRRLKLWKNALEAISHKPIFGYGLAGTSKSFVSVTGEAEPAHSTVLEIAGQVGIPSVIIILFLFCYAAKKGNFFAKLICLCTIITTIFISAETTVVFWLNLGIAFLMNKKVKMDEGFNCERLN